MPDLDPRSNNLQAWEDHYAADHTPWDQGMPHPMLSTLVQDGRLAGRVLAPGCGGGHDVECLRIAGLDAWGIDVAPSAVTKAIARYPEARFEQQDLFDLPDTYTAAFDAVWEHTCFCAIHPDQRRAYAAAIHQCLKPGGRLVACFYLTHEPEEIPGPPYKIPRDVILEYFTEHFTIVEQDICPNSYDQRRGNELLAVLERR